MMIISNIKARRYEKISCGEVKDDGGDGCGEVTNDGGDGYGEVTDDGGDGCG